MAFSREQELEHFFRQVESKQKGNCRRNELIRAVWHAAKNELTSRQLECVVLFYGENLSVQEIAAKLEVYPSTVSRHLKKARSRIKRALQYGYFPIWKETEHPQDDTPSLFYQGEPGLRLAARGMGGRKKES